MNVIIIKIKITVERLTVKRVNTIVARITLKLNGVLSGLRLRLTLVKLALVDKEKALCHVPALKLREAFATLTPAFIEL